MDSGRSAVLGGGDDLRQRMSSVGKEAVDVAEEVRAVDAEFREEEDEAMKDGVEDGAEDLSHGSAGVDVATILRGFFVLHGGRTGFEREGYHALF